MVFKDTSKEMSAMIFYDPSINDYTVSVYINRPGPSFGYFFRVGGSIAETEDSIAEIHIEGCNERAFVSLNKQQVNRIEVDHGNTVEIIEVDSTKPFAYILPVNAGAVTIYDLNGNIIKSIQQ